MRKRLLLLLLLTCFAPSQTPEKPRKWFGGTFIGAVVVEDGVVVGSDTRSTFIDDSGKQFGYIDGIPKVFVQNGSALAISGLSSVSGELFSSFVNRNEYLLERPVNEILFGVMLGLPFRNSSKVLLISAGFENGHPMICAKNPNDPQVCRSSGFITNRESAESDPVAHFCAWHSSEGDRRFQCAAAGHSGIGGSGRHCRRDDFRRPYHGKTPRRNGWKVCREITVGKPCVTSFPTISEAK